MATAKKTPAKKVTRRPAAKKAAPAVKRVVRRRAKPVAAEEQAAAEILKQDTLTDSSLTSGSTAELPEDPLFTTDVVDLRGVFVVARIAILIRLAQAGYLFVHFTNERDPTELFHQYLGQDIQGLKLQHNNKLIEPMQYDLNELPPHTLFTKPIAASVAVDVMMEDTSIAAPKTIRLGGTVYNKAD